MNDAILALAIIEREARKRTSNPEHNAVIALDSHKIRLMLSKNEDLHANLANSSKLKGERRN